MAEKKGKYKIDDDLKEGLHKAGEEIKKGGKELEKDLGELGRKVTGKSKK